MQRMRIDARGLVHFTVETDPGLSVPNDSIPPQQGMDKRTRNTSYDHISAGSCKASVSNTTKLQGPDSPEDDLVIIVNESDEDEPNAETKDTSVHRSSSPSSLPAEMKDLPSKFNELTKEIKGLKA
nr:hypothetical protein [Tanacetum cinerariifolium]